MNRKVLAGITATLLISGCASSTTEYYQAVEAAAQANAAASQAKFNALSAIAASGDGQAASAAVMALALTQTTAVTPIPQQSQALQWASILAAPISNLGMMWMQTDSTKTMARYNSQVDLARISADATTQQALYGSFVASASAGYEAMGNVDYTPFVDGMVTLGSAGIDGAVDLGTAGFDANTAIATTGMDNLTALGTTGMNNLTTLGTASITGMQTMGLGGFDALVTLDADNNDLYSNVWTQYQSSLQSILDTMVTCSATTAADGSQTITCN